MPTNDPQLETGIDDSIDIRYEGDLETAFNKFIKKWCGKWYPHLIDSDENDGQFIRDKIYELQRAREKAFNLAIREVLEYLDILELKQPEDYKTDNWKNWKYIRNSIRDKYHQDTPKGEV